MDLPTFFDFAKKATSTEQGSAEIAEILGRLPATSRPVLVRALESLVDALQPHSRTRRVTATGRRRRR